MSIYKSAKSPFFHFDFQIGGRRFFGSTKARNKKDAEAVERELKRKAKVDIEAEAKSGNGPLTIDVAAGRYWTEVGQHHAGNDTTWRDLERLIKFFGKTKRMDEISDADVAALVSWRRSHTIMGKSKDTAGKPASLISSSTVNRSTTMVLKTVFIRARRTWRYSFPREPSWRDHMLKEPAERVRELHAGEAEALDAAVRPDYAPWLAFCRASGLRLRETLIRWNNVNWDSLTITTLGKGGKNVTTPITPTVAAILEPLKDHHPDHVFTYVALRTRDGRIRGQRYPIAYDGAKIEWRRLRARSKVKNFRFHDIRHDVATKLLRETGNLKLVQKALNHRDLKTTARYAHVIDDEVAAALERVAKSRKKSLTGGGDAS